MSQSAHISPATKASVEPLDAAELSALLPNAADREFLRRVWSTPIQVYLDRLRAVTFEGMECVLDAGCGFGQWSRALSRLNDVVHGVDVDPHRIRTAIRLDDESGTPSVSFRQSTLERLPFDDSHFEGVFCYSVIYLTDVPAALHELSRVLCRGGLLYVNTNDLGWYLYNLLENHNGSDHFSSHQMAVDALAETVSFYATGRRSIGTPVVTPKETFLKALAGAGFDVLATGGDGEIRMRDDARPRTFYPAVHYGHTSVYEVLCRKR